MGKNNPCLVLKTVFKDISNIETVIKDSKRIEQSCDQINFDNDKDVVKLIEDTKTIVDSLKSQVTQIDHYFDENYTKWKQEFVSLLCDESIDAESNDVDSQEAIVAHKDNLEDKSLKANENVDKKLTAENDDKENEAVDDNASETSQKDKQKLFLKCVDITKLINPNIVISKKTTEGKKKVSANDAVMIISDSDDESSAVNKKAKQAEAKSRKQNMGNINKETASKVQSATSSKTKSTAADEDDIILIRTYGNKNLRKKQDLSKNTVKKTKTTSSRSSKHQSDTSSASDSDNTLNSASASTSIKPRTRRKNVGSNINDKSKANLIIHTRNDKKLLFKAYVPLIRTPCEKLKEDYVRDKEIRELKRLTNMSSAKRSRVSSEKDQNSRSSSDTDKTKKSTHKRARVEKVVSPESSSDEQAPECVKKLNNNEFQTIEASGNIELGNDTVKMIVDGIKSGTDSSSNESVAKNKEENTKKKSTKSKTKQANKEKQKDSDGEMEGGKETHKEKQRSGQDKMEAEKQTDTEKQISDQEKMDKEKQTSDGEQTKKKAQTNEEKATSDTNKRGEKGKKDKSKGQKDDLLKGNISETDSEDEFITFKKHSDNAKQHIKSRMGKKKSMIVIDSDSQSDDDRKKTKDSSDEFEPQKKSSSSESEDEKDNDSEPDEAEKKKRRRIKRLKDSSEDEDKDKSTRKTIRKVIGRESLAETTKQAEKAELERKARILERQKKYNQIFDADKLSNATVDKLILDFNEETKKEIIGVHSDLVKKLKPHQATGVQFMWNACFESVEQTKKTNGSGCILAHCMGLGKTLQVITLIHTLLMNEELTGVERVLVVCPLNTVLNWVAEFTKWLDDLKGTDINVYEIVSCKQNEQRRFQVSDWMRSGGVMVLGYDMFRNLTNPNNKRLRKSYRETFHEGLVNPGADLVVCDEGHLLKNEKTNLSIAMNRIRTVRRIVLTGTPMQNNLKEYYCMVQFVKPNLLGTYKEYLNRFVNPITNGQYTDSTDLDINVMRKRSHVLHKMLDGLVQRKDYSVLTPYLPPKYEYVLFLTLSEVQINLYRHYLDEQSRRPSDSKLRTTFLFMDFQEFQRICTHPRLLMVKSQERSLKRLLDEDEDSEGSLKDFIDDKDESSAESTDSDSGSVASADTVKSDKKISNPGRTTRNSAAAAGIDIEQETEEVVQTNEWWGQFCHGVELENIVHGSKLYLLFEILQQCELIGDKLLVFSQSLYSLNVIEHFLAKIDEASQKGDNDSVCGFSGSWALGLDYFRLDGSSSCDNRTAWCNSFNSASNPRARLFLISTKAGGLGINLIGANRVVIFDVSWNPSHDIQSIYRVYRFGQTKPCYIYRFVTNGTMEMKIYERQVTKQAISKRVIDEQQIDRHYNQNDLAELYKFDPKPDDQPTPLLPKDLLLAELLQKQKDKIFKYHEHQSLLENKQDEELNEDERKAAWEEFESEKTARVAANNSGGWIKNLPLNSVAAALVNIVKKDNPEWTQQQVQNVVPIIIQQLREQVDKGETMLFNRVVNELKLMQATQQQRLQEYYMQQQLRLLQQQMLQQQQQHGSTSNGGFDFNSTLRRAFMEQSPAAQSNEIVELND